MTINKCLLLSISNYAEAKSKYTASPVLLTPKPASHLSLAALDATSLGTKFPNAGYLLSRK